MEGPTYREGRKEDQSGIYRAGRAFGAIIHGVNLENNLEDRLTTGKCNMWEELVSMNVCFDADWFLIASIDMQNATKAVSRPSLTAPV